MLNIEVKPDIYWIGVDDRDTDLFEGLWPIRNEGISYNSYLINDRNKAIIDLAKSFKSEEIFKRINEITDISEIDYVIVNHMEPDHSGILKTIRRINPDIKIVGTDKTVDMLEAFYGIKENTMSVEDGEEIKLGEKTLKFFHTPMVHWPETMMTYEIENKVLFSCDAFGGYGALGGSIFDDNCIDLDFYESESLRYYANIVVKFSKMVKRAISKLEDVKLNMVAPSHGRIWRENPEDIIKLYSKWADYADGDAEEGVTLIYGTMYGNTEAMMNAVAQGISEAGVPLNVFDAKNRHMSYILSSVLKYNGVMIGTPTYEASMFPAVFSILQMIEDKGIKNRKSARFGSYGWSGGAQKDFEEIAEKLNWEIIDSFEFRGGPSEDELKSGLEFGRNFGDSIKNE